MTVTEVLCYKVGVNKYVSVSDQIGNPRRRGPGFFRSSVQSLMRTRAMHNENEEHIGCPARLKIVSVLCVEAAIDVTDRVYPIAFGDQSPEALYFSRVELTQQIRNEAKGIS